MRDIEKEIQKNLSEIEIKHNVRILYAVESGSRAWGFASPDSDYDVRFIYVQKFEDYIRIDPGKDVIEWQLDEVLDINGWDLKKALLAFAKGNPNVMEWANSPIVYRRAEEWACFDKVIRQFFSEKASICHYYGTANSTYHGFLMGDKVKYKKYLYALRSLLCCRWIEKNHSIPPMKFEELLTLFDGTQEELNDELLKAIELLLKRKTVTVEGELNEHIPEIIDFIKRELPRQKEISDAMADDREKDYSRINELFFDVLKKRI